MCLHYSWCPTRSCRLGVELGGKLLFGNRLAGMGAARFVVIAVALEFLEDAAHSGAAVFGQMRAQVGFRMIELIGDAYPRRALRTRHACRRLAAGVAPAFQRLQQ